MTKKKPTKLDTFNKYTYYERSVQNVESDIDFINENFKKFRKRDALTLREDFCGTAKLACDWVKQSAKHMAQGIDLDPEPVDYGKKHHYSTLTKDQQKRMTYLLEDVRKDRPEKFDVTVAFNFSYFIFKTRRELLHYFESVRKSLGPDGIFFIDLFGGPESQTVMEEETEHDDFSYFWDCDKFNPITNECLFKIHFKPEDSKRIDDVFVYDWRMWGMAELREILCDAGFSKTVGYWEEDDEEDESGSGDFYITDDAENCEAWVTYIAALV